MLPCMSHLFHKRTSCITNKEKPPHTGSEGNPKAIYLKLKLRVHMDLARFFIVESGDASVHYIKFKMCLRRVNETLKN